MMDSKGEGTSLIMVDGRRRILLLLRDDIPEIPWPGMWDIPGGHVEENETPDVCIVREMEEEMGLHIAGHRLFSVVEFEDRIEYVYWMSVELDIEAIRLTEGQRLSWFTERQAAAMELACGFNVVVTDFFRKAPFENSRGE